MREDKNFKRYVVRNFNEFLKVIKEIRSKENKIWYRGQPNASYMLLPSAMRKMIEFQDQFGQEIQPKEVSNFNNRGHLVSYINVNAMLKEFKNEATKYLRVKPKNDFEWMFLAQHYGIPTKLLDWSTDPLVALFFAMPEVESESDDTDIEIAIKEFENSGYSNQGAAVFAINPIEFNTNTANYIYKDKNRLYEPVDVSENYDFYNSFIYPTDEKYFILPLCILGTAIDKRICRQSGNFTIHGINVWPLDQSELLRSMMYKIFIPYACISEIKEILDALNINKSSIYCGDSDLDFISKEISDSEKNKFNKFIEELIQKYSKALSDKK